MNLSNVPVVFTFVSSFLFYGRAFQSQKGNKEFYQIITLILEGAKIKIQSAQKPSASKERVHSGAGHLWELFVGVESSNRVLSRQPY